MMNKVKIFPKFYIIVALQHLRWFCFICSNHILQTLLSSICIAYRSFY